MAITAASLVAIVSVKGADEAAAKLAMVGDSAKTAGGLLGGLAIGGAALAIGLVAAGIGSLKMAADFQQGVNRLKTGAGDTTDNLVKLGQGILRVSTATGILTNGTDGLNAAMYLVASTGQRGAQALDTLKAAAQGAQIEQAKVVDVTQILTTLQKNFGISTHTTTQYMDGLVSAVSHGKITLEDLSTAMSPILPFAHQLGIHFADVAAAMSDMTNQGIPAAQAATALRFTMQSMILPTKASQKAMQEWGLDSAKVAETMKTSLPDALQMYIDAAKHAGAEGTKPFIDALATMMGGGQRAAKALFSLSQSMGDWRTMIGQVNTAMASTSKDVNGWATVQGNLNLQLDRGKAVLADVAIQAGTLLLPVVTKLVKGFADWASNTNFSGLLSNLQAVGTQVGNLFGELGNITKFTMNSQSWKDAAAAIGEASNQIGAFTAKVQTAISQNASLTSGLKDAWNGIGDGIKQVADGFAIFGDMGTFLMDKFNGQAINTRAAFLLMGKDANTAMLSVADATWLVESGIKMVTDATTGADINLQKYVKTADLSGSSTVTMAHALELVGKHTGDLLNAADAAKLLALHIGNVKDMSTGAVTDLKTLQKQLSMTFDQSQLQKYYAYLLQGGLQTFAQWSAADYKATEAFLANQAKMRGDTDNTRKHLAALGGPFEPVVKTSSVIAASTAADNARKHLIAINGPYEPLVNNNSTTAATIAADNARRHLIAINGPYEPIINQGSILSAIGSVGTLYQRLLATARNYSATFTTFYNTVGTPPHGTPFASGTESAPGGLALVGEQGPELVTLPRGARVNTAAQTHAILAGGGGSGGGGGGQQPITVNVYLNGRALTSELMPHIVSQIRSAVGTISS